MGRQVIFILYIAFLLKIQNASSQDIMLAKLIDTYHQSVVAILRADSTGKTFLAGSGVLIHPNVILTAGHINFSTVKWWDKDCAPIGYISFGNNALISNDRVPFDWINDVVTHPDVAELLKIYADTTMKNNPRKFSDIGLIFLDQPVLNKPPFHLPDTYALANLGENDLLLGVGYGYHIRDTVFQGIPGLVDGLRRKWQLSQISLINDLWLKTDCDSASGLPYLGMFDSGAPLLLNDIQVVGIWGYIDDPSESCLAPSLASRIDDPKVIKWIQKSIKSRLSSKEFRR